MKAVVIAGAIGVLVAGSGAAMAQKLFFAAIAYSPTTRMIGVAADNASRAEAERVAMANCRSEAGSPTDCKNAAWAQDGCVALAVSSQGAWGGNYGANSSAAMRNAVAMCAKYAGNDQATCSVVRWICTDGR